MSGYPNFPDFNEIYPKLSRTFPDFRYFCYVVVTRLVLYPLIVLLTCSSHLTHLSFVFVAGDLWLASPPVRAASHSCRSRQRLVQQLLEVSWPVSPAPRVIGSSGSSINSISMENDGEKSSYAYVWECEWITWYHVVYHVLRWRLSCLISSNVSLISRHGWIMNNGCFSKLRNDRCDRHYSKIWIFFIWFPNSFLTLWLPQNRLQSPKWKCASPSSFTVLYHFLDFSTCGFAFGLAQCAEVRGVFMC